MFFYANPKKNTDDKQTKLHDSTGNMFFFKTSTVIGFEK